VGETQPGAGDEGGLIQLASIQVVEDAKRNLVGQLVIHPRGHLCELVLRSKKKEKLN
jgi:hypothetical protein